MGAPIVEYESNDLEAIRAFLAARGAELDIADAVRPGSTRTTLRTRHMQRCYVARSRYGAAGKITKCEPDWAWNYGVSFALSGEVEARTDHGNFTVRPSQAVIRPPVERANFVWSEGTTKTFVSVRPEAVQTYLACLVDKPVVGRVTFLPQIDVDGQVGSMLLSAISLALDATPTGLGNVAQQLQEAAFEETLFSILLLHQPHSHEAMLTDPMPAPSPRDVKRAIDYVQANLSDPVRLVDLIEAAGVPGRTLNEHFRRFTGLSPLAYLTNARLAHARQLLKNNQVTTVTEAATGSGFFHLGRFSKEYMRAFGEPPSATLQAARRAD